MSQKDYQKNFTKGQKQKEGAVPSHSSFQQKQKIPEPQVSRLGTNQSKRHGESAENLGKFDDLNRVVAGQTMSFGGLKSHTNLKEPTLQELSIGGNSSGAFAISGGLHKKSHQAFRYKNSSKDFTASADALGQEEFSDGHRVSAHGYQYQGIMGAGGKYNLESSSNLMSQEMRLAKLSELDEEAMDSPRTSKLLAARDYQSSGATSSMMLHHQNIDRSNSGSVPTDVLRSQLIAQGSQDQPSFQTGSSQMRSENSKQIKGGHHILENDKSVKHLGRGSYQAPSIEEPDLFDDGQIEIRDSQNEFSDDGDQLLDLSNIKNADDLNQLTVFNQIYQQDKQQKTQKQNRLNYEINDNDKVIDVDQIELDIHEDFKNQRDDVFIAQGVRKKQRKEQAITNKNRNEGQDYQTSKESYSSSPSAQNIQNDLAKLLQAKSNSSDEVFDLNDKQINQNDGIVQFSNRMFTPLAVTPEDEIKSKLAFETQLHDMGEGQIRFKPDENIFLGEQPMDDFGQMNLRSENFENLTGSQENSDNGIDTQSQQKNQKTESEKVEEGPLEEQDSFHRLYNKEIKVNQDEIPLLLMELTDIAFKFIKKEQYEKAYVLLQKTESVLEVVNLEHSRRDKYFAFITYHNMAMCFQKLGMLDECIIYLKETLSVLASPKFFKDVTIALRLRQSQMLCQLRLQLCAILSQTQKHTEAIDNAKYSVRLIHHILRDMYDLCVFYSNKIKFKDDFASLSLLLMDEPPNKNKANRSGNVSQTSKEDGNKFTKSQLNERQFQRDLIKENSPVKDIPPNILEESISMIERTALKLLPIMKELGNRLAGVKGKSGQNAFQSAISSSDENILSRDNPSNYNIKEKITAKLKNKSEGFDDSVSNISPSKAEDEKVDMRTVLGFLNQNEWVTNLNIGNIMQIQPVRMRDLMQSSRNELQLSRESFLEKLQLLIVAYFCVSTEMRFIVQARIGLMKPEVRKEKELEQEYWHVKALDIACAFLPSECPLFNHVLFSYQKHHDPTLQPIKEDEEQQDEIRALRPLKGIENSKFQPLIRDLKYVNVEVLDIQSSPLSKCFDQRLLPAPRIHTKTANCQTEEIQKSQPVSFRSQTISVQKDLLFSFEGKNFDDYEDKKTQFQKNNLIEDSLIQSEEKQPINFIKKTQDCSVMTEQLEPFNVYSDLSHARYHDSLAKKISEDPMIGDSKAFLSLLIKKLQKKEPNNRLMSQLLEQVNNNQKQNNEENKKNNLYDGPITYSIDGLSPVSREIDDQNENNIILGKLLKKNTTLSTFEQVNKVQEIYGTQNNRQKTQSKQNLYLQQGKKITQSGLIQQNKINSKYKDNLKRGKPYNIDQKSQQILARPRSLYGEASVNSVVELDQANSQSLAATFSEIETEPNLFSKEIIESFNNDNRILGTSQKSELVQIVKKQKKLQQKQSKLESISGSSTYAGQRTAVGTKDKLKKYDQMNEDSVATHQKREHWTLKYNDSVNSGSQTLGLQAFTAIKEPAVMSTFQYKPQTTKSEQGNSQQLHKTRPTSQTGNNRSQGILTGLQTMKQQRFSHSNKKKQCKEEREKKGSQKQFTSQAKAGEHSSNDRTTNKQESTMDCSNIQGKHPRIRDKNTSTAAATIKNKEDLQNLSQLSNLDKTLVARQNIDSDLHMKSQNTLKDKFFFSSHASNLEGEGHPTEFSASSRFATKNLSAKHLDHKIADSSLLEHENSKFVTTKTVQNKKQGIITDKNIIFANNLDHQRVRCSSVLSNQSKNKVLNSRMQQRRRKSENSFTKSNLIKYQKQLAHLKEQQSKLQQMRRQANKGQKKGSKEKKLSEKTSASPPGSLTKNKIFQESKKNYSGNERSASSGAGKKSVKSFKFQNEGLFSIFDQSNISKSKIAKANKYKNDEEIRQIKKNYENVQQKRNSDLEKKQYNKKQIRPGSKLNMSSKMRKDRIVEQNFQTQPLDIEIFKPGVAPVVTKNESNKNTKYFFANQTHRNEDMIKTIVQQGETNKRKTRKTIAWSNIQKLKKGGSRFGNPRMSIENKSNSNSRSHSRDKQVKKSGSLRNMQTQVIAQIPKKKQMDQQELKNILKQISQKEKKEDKRANVEQLQRRVLENQRILLENLNFKEKPDHRRQNSMLD